MKPTKPLKTSRNIPYRVLDIYQKTLLPFLYRDKEVRKHLEQLQNYFYSTLQFLKKTPVNKLEEVYLSELPQLLLIGPPQAGKTTLLAHAQIHYVLQKTSNSEQKPTEKCEWWVTPDISIIDVPSNYLFPNKNSTQFNIAPLIWRCFLRLLKKNFAKNSLQGIILALPASEIFKLNAAEYKAALITPLIERLQEVKKIWGINIPCHIVITQCDVIPGFLEFFSESNNDEITQAWGINLPEVNSINSLQKMLVEKFDHVIKKLNQQLIWRLHQERNPMLRPAINDFPQQMERCKDQIINFVNDFQHKCVSIKIKSIYFTSAMQVPTTEPPLIIDVDNLSHERGLQLFKPPHPLTRPYFIKQLLQSGFGAKPLTPAAVVRNKWKKRMAYSASFAIVASAGFVFGHDFQLGISQAHSIQKNIADYQVALLRAQDPNEELTKTLALINTLYTFAKEADFQFDFRHILNFYSFKAKQKAAYVYQHSLQAILLPEIKTYVEKFLKTPVNKNNEKVYAALKTYLMLGDREHLQSEYVLSTLKTILPQNFSPQVIATLEKHLHTLFNSHWQPLPLNTALIADTRQYLTALPSYDLGYLILKTYNDNNAPYPLPLEMSFALKPTKPISAIPMMFTAKNFAAIYTQQTFLAATEATTGNWVLGEIASNSAEKPDNPVNIVEQLRTSYVNNYVDTWESILDNIQLLKSNNLTQTQQLIDVLISDNSPLLQFLKILHDNTYFEPVISSSAKLQNVGTLLDVNPASQQHLFKLFAALRQLNIHLQTIQNASNEPKAAFEAISKRVQNQLEPDIITQLRIVASDSPEPIKSWLQEIANETWRYLMQDAGHYMNTASQQNINLQ